MIQRMKALGATLAVLAISGGTGAMACSTTDGCQALCQKSAWCCMAQAGCDPDSVAIPQCLLACRDLSSKQAAYKETLEDEASCFESSTCQEFMAGKCVEQP